MAQTVEGAPQPAEEASARPNEPEPTPTPQPRRETVVTPGGRTERSAARRARVVVRRVGPLSVLKFSLIFYFCLMLIFFFGILFLYGIMGALGITDQAAKLIGNLVSDAGENFRFNGSWIFTRLFLIGCAMTVVWSIINVFIAFLYNLISDVVGGVEVTLAERR